MNFRTLAALLVSTIIYQSVAEEHTESKATGKLPESNQKQAERKWLIDWDLSKHQFEIIEPDPQDKLDEPFELEREDHSNEDAVLSEHEGSESDHGDGGPDEGGPGDGDLGNGDQGNGDQANGGQGNGDQANGGQGNGDQGNGDQANGGQGNGDQVNGGQGNGDQGNGDQANGGQANGDQANGGQANGDQANGDQANGGQANGGQGNGGQGNGGQADPRDLLSQLRNDNPMARLRRASRRVLRPRREVPEEDREPEPLLNRLENAFVNMRVNELPPPQEENEHLNFPQDWSD